MRFAALILAAASALALSACTTTETASSGSGAHCFRPAQVTGYSVVDDSRVRVRAGTNDYIFTIRGRTSELDWTHAIAVQSTEQLICPGGTTLGVYLVGGQPPLRYAVANVEMAPEDGPTGS